MKKIKNFILGTSPIWIPIALIIIANKITTALGWGLID